MAQQGPQVLEKTLVPLQLAKGVNQGVREELLGDTELVACENLVQDQAGCFTKRPGLIINGYTDQDGNGINRPKKIFQSTTGNLCIVSTNSTGDGCSLYEYDKFSQYPRKKSKICEFSIRSRNIVSSSVRPLKDGQRVFGVASSSVYTAVAYESPRGTNGDLTIALAIYSNGQLIAKYDVPTDASGFAGAGSAGIKMAFVGDRYFHCHAYAAGIIKSFVHDSWAKWPDDATGFTYTGPAAFAGDPITDIATDEVNGTSLVSWGTHIDTLTNAGAYTEYDLVADGWVEIRSISVSATYLAAFGSGPSGSDFAVYAAITPGTVVTAISAVGGAINSARADIAIGSTAAGVSLYLSESTSHNLGSTTTRKVRVYYSADILASTPPTLSSEVFGWEVFGKPLYMSGSREFYQHLVKSDTADTVNHTPATLAPHVLACISDPTSTSIGALAAELNTFRPVASLELYNAYRVTTPLLYEAPFFSSDSLRYRALSADGVNLTLVTPNNPSQRSGIAGIHELRINDPNMCWSTAAFGSELVTSAGSTQQYDADRAFECGMVDYPLADFTAVALAGGVDPGLHNYVVVYRHLDSSGNVALSRTFGPYSITVAPGSEEIEANILACHMTARESGRSADYQVQVEVYRTVVGGKRLYLCGSSQVPTDGSTLPPGVQVIDQTLPNLFMNDIMTDAVLQSQPEMYRQPLLGPGGALDRHAPPGTSVVCQHRDRLFVADAYGSKVYYSSFFVDGESAWFNPQFSFFIHGGTGPITAIASLDGRLVIFKKDSIFVVDGDGPPENGGSGAEFSSPQRVSADIGCVSVNSIVTIPTGIMFRSQRGIELLSRRLDVLWIGERVQTSVNANQYTVGCTFNRSGSFVKYLVASTYDSTGAFYGTGEELVYDIGLDMWTTAKYTPSGSPGGYGYSLQGICQAITANDSVQRTVYADWADYTYTASPTTKTDGTYYVPFTIETSWKKTSGPHERQRVFDAFFLSKKLADSNHALTMSFAYDYGGYTQTKTWEPGTFVSLPLEEFNLQPSKMVNCSVKLKVNDAAPADTVTYPVGYGAGCDVLGITWKIAAKNTGPQLASGQKA
jgi:hypothetical protein